MNPGGVAGLAIAVAITLLYFGTATAWAAVAAAIAVFLLGAVIPIEAAEPSGTVPDDPENWRRVGVIFPILCLFLTHLVFEIFDAAMKSVAVLVDSRAGLEQARHESDEQTTALLAIEQGATQAEVMRTAGQVAGSVAHDLNNALTPIIGWAELLAAQSDPVPDDVVEAVQVFSESADYAEALIDQLDYGEQEGGAAIESVEMKALVEESTSVIRRLVGPNVDVETRLESGCIVSIDRTRLRRVLMNLATNARDAMPDGGRLSFEVTRNELGVVLSISDDGTGMDHETARHVFEAFYTTKEPGHGTGLGLLGVSRIVEASGGKIDVESELGEGARFTIRWPDSEPFD
jgi:signal transduction histidine kinase